MVLPAHARIVPGLSNGQDERLNGQFVPVQKDSTRQDVQDRDRGLERGEVLAVLAGQYTALADTGRYGTGRARRILAVPARMY